MNLQEKGEILRKIVNVNLGDSEESLKNHVKFTRKWDSKIKVYVVKPCKKTLELLENNKEYKLINFLTCSNIIPHVNENSPQIKILYNFIPSLHLSMLNEAIDLQLNDTSERVVPLIVVAEI